MGWIFNWLCHIDVYLQYCFRIEEKKCLFLLLKHFCFPFYLYFGQRKRQGLSSWPAGDWGISPWGDVTLLRKWILHKGQEKLSPGNITPNMPRNNFELNTYSVCLSPYFGTKLHPKEHLKEILGQWVSSHHKGQGLNFLSILMDRIWRLFISLQCTMVLSQCKWVS